MSRGRKSKESVTDINVWQKYFNQNIWAYFKIIISNLSNNPPLTAKSGNDILISIRTVDKRIVYDVKEEEIPFDIPINWAWTKLPSICEISTGNKDVNEGDYNGVYPFFTCAQEPLKSNTFTFDDDCILLPGNGANVGHVSRYKGKFELYQRTYCLHSIHKLISVDFLHYYLRAFWKSNLGTQYGSGINYLRISNFNNFLIPIPPIEEQNLIVNFLNAFELNEIKIDQYYFSKEIETFVILLHKKQLITSELLYKSKNQLTQLDNLNQAILQEAVQGKLVPQDHKDEPASELLKRIKAEKAKSGKKEKPLPPIKPEEIPFEIPKNWVWCRLGEMFDIERGSSPRPKGDPRYFSKSKTPFNWITISDMTAFAKDAPLSDTREYLTELGTKHSRHVTTKDIIIVASGSAGRTSLLGIDGFIYDGLMSVKNIQFDVMRIFLYYLFRVFEASMMKVATGATWQNINTDILKSQPIPLPPLSEQKRIVAEIEKQLAKTNQLKEHIIANQQATEQLLKALLHQAFEVEEMEEV